MCHANVLQLEIVSHMGKSVKQNKFPAIYVAAAVMVLKAIKYAHSVMLFALRHRMCENSIELAG